MTHKIICSPVPATNGAPAGLAFFFHMSLAPTNVAAHQIAAPNGSILSVLAVAGLLAKVARILGQAARFQLPVFVAKVAVATALGTMALFDGHGPSGAIRDTVGTRHAKGIRCLALVAFGLAHFFKHPFYESEKITRWKKFHW